MKPAFPGLLHPAAKWIGISVHGELQLPLIERWQISLVDQIAYESLLKGVVNVATELQLGAMLCFATSYR